MHIFIILYQPIIREAIQVREGQVTLQPKTFVEGWKHYTDHFYKTNGILITSGDSFSSSKSFFVTSLEMKRV